MRKTFADYVQAQCSCRPDYVCPFCRHWLRDYWLNENPRKETHFDHHAGRPVSTGTSARSGSNTAI